MKKVKMVCIYLLLFSCISCKSQENKQEANYIYIKIKNTFHDTCIVFKNAVGDTINFYRNIQVIENSFTDTLNIGFSILLPSDTGKIFLAQIDTTRDKALYNNPDYISNVLKADGPETKTKYLCIYHFPKRYSTKTDETLIIKIRINNK